MALYLLCDKTGFGIYVMSAVVLHELGHLICMAILHLPPKKILFFFFGILIENPTLLTSGYEKEVLVMLSGPAMNFLFSLFAFWGYGDIALFGIFNFVMGVFNLLPLTGLDGGSALRCFLQRYLSLKASRIICVVVSLVLLAPLGAFCALMLREGRYNITFFVMFGYLFYHLLRD